jgi:hypothetical protein
MEDRSAVQTVRPALESFAFRHPVAISYWRSQFDQVWAEPSRLCRRLLEFDDQAEVKVERPRALVSARVTGRALM